MIAYHFIAGETSWDGEQSQLILCTTDVLIAVCSNLQQQQEWVPVIMLLIITTSNHIPSVQVSVHLSTEENQDGPERVRISQTVLSRLPGAWYLHSRALHVMSCLRILWPLVPIVKSIEVCQHWLLTGLDSILGSGVEKAGFEPTLV